MIHTFIRLYYFNKFTYSWGHFVLIILVLLLISFSLSFLIEVIKRVIKYNELISKLINRIELA
jgi:uncharacterized membrane protein